MFRTLLFAVFLILFALSSNAQEPDNAAAVKTLNAAKTVTVVVVGESAKFTYKATKFSAKNVAKPIVAKAAPAAGKFVLKQSGKVVKRSIPVMAKIAVKYAKYKFLP
ncbi:MAG: hypothetical protein R2681_03230 [Pyrinomonadaceae bacterium]